MFGIRPRSAPRVRKAHAPRHRTSGKSHTPTASTISANFNSYHIDAGNTIWFNSAGKVTGLGTGTDSLHISDATVSFAANGTNYTVNVPNTTVTFTPLATSASVSYSSDGWLVTTPLAFNGNVFLGGAA